MSQVRILVDGEPRDVPAGKSVAAAVWPEVVPPGPIWPERNSPTAGFRRSVVGEWRAPLCGMGICFECRLTIDGIPHQRSCQRLCTPGMAIQTAKGQETTNPNPDMTPRATTPCAAAPETGLFGVLVVGGGPAGIAAAVKAAEILGPGRVVLLDDNPAPGGQIWRHGAEPPPAAATAWLDRLARAGVERISGATVVDARPAADHFVALVDQADRLLAVRGQRLILAPGATERFLPFPGWTLPGVVGAGGLQALIKGGLEVRGQRVVVAGSGPLLMAVAALLRQKGAMVVAMLEQTPRAKFLRFASHALTRPSKWRQAFSLAWQTRSLRRHFSSWPLRAEGDGRLERVVFRDSTGAHVDQRCDLLAVGYGLVPATGLARLLGCELAAGQLVVDANLETTVPGIFGAGEILGVGGVDRALLDGQIAGAAAAGRPDPRLARARRREWASGTLLERCFALREELRQVVEDDTLVCRCEDVTWGEIRRHFTSRDAKLKTRCGMGPCQGRVCGGALDFLAGFRPDTVRPPLFPVSLRLLTELAAHSPKSCHPESSQPDSSPDSSLDSSQPDPTRP